MNLLKTFILVLSTLVINTTFADVSVHVLDTNKGLPGKNIEVQFYEKSGNQWKLISTKKTDEDGRIKKFDLGDGLEYRAVFNVDDFFNRQEIESFYSSIPVDFIIKRKDSHYHIPLLLSPYAYSTYRGN